MRKNFYSMFLAMFAILAMCSPIVADDTVIGTTPTPTASWSPPTTGSPVVYYVLQLFETEGLMVWSINVADTTTVVAEQIIEPLIRYRARVAGVDQHDRQGPWSLWSNDYIFDYGLPDAPGTPVWTIVVE